LWDAVQNGDLKRAEELHFATQRLARTAVLNAQLNFPGSVKAAIDSLGREAGRARTPIKVPTGEKKREIEAAIEHMHNQGIYEAE
jgi:dihydrodipicolinate synthase/N-acetylneuraminate lyase